MELPFAKELFSVLVCPDAQVPLKFVDGKLISTDAATRRAYRIEDDIPIMLVNESEILSEEQWQAAMDAPGIRIEDVSA
ncbi:MAG: hypothetical protein HRU15_16625 [Planctomycetes bacterium]|nr:hypothetical protein [Planctomycetota bacterium]